MKKFYVMVAVVLLLGFKGQSQTQTIGFPMGGIAKASDVVPLYTNGLNYDQHTQLIYPASVIPPELKGGQITKITLNVTHYINPWGSPQVTIKLINISDLTTTLSNLKQDFLDVSSANPIYEGDFQIIRLGEEGKIYLNFNTPASFVYTGEHLLMDITSVGGSLTPIPVAFKGENSPVDSCVRRRPVTTMPPGQPKPFEYMDKFLPRLTVEYIPGKVEKVVTLPCSNITHSALTLNGRAFEITGHLGFKYKINSGAWQYAAAEKENMNGYIAMRYPVNTGLNTGSVVTYSAWGKGTTDTLWGEVYNVTIQPNCMSPTLTDVTPITATGATVNWMTGSPSTDFNIRYKPVSATDWIYKNHVSDGVLTALSAGTVYEVQVQTVCSSSSTSSWSAVKTFRTACGAMPVPYFEDFTTGLSLEELCYVPKKMLAGVPEYFLGIMEVDHVEKNVKILNNTGSGPTYEFYFMLPKFNVDVNQLRLRFRAHSASQLVKTEIGVTRVDDPALFSLVEIMEDPLGSTPDIYTFQLNKYDLPLTGTERICIRFILKYGLSVRVEDVEVTVDGNDCLPPYNVTVGNVAENQATVDWIPEPAQTEWSVQYRFYTENDWTNWQSVTTSTHPHILTGLQKATDYQVRVRTVCGEEMSSPSNVVVFKTSGTGGISKFGLLSVKVYYLNSVCIVNPDNLMIKNVEIIDLYGRVVYQGGVNHNPEIINMNVPTGVYIVRVMTGDRVGDYKLIITN